MRSAPAALVVLLLSAPAIACTGDLECGPAARCVKASGTLQGRCVAEVFAPAPAAQLPAGGAAGAARKTCTFDSDCGKDATCLRTGSETTGLCVRH